MLPRDNFESYLVDGKTRYRDTFSASILRQCSQDELCSIEDALQELCVIQLELAKQGKSVLTCLLSEKPSLQEWEHAPSPDVYAPKGRCQYYYHAHPVETRESSEHGHFHAFFDINGTNHQRSAVSHQRVLSHLIGISMNERGHITRLFSVNSWVGDDEFLPADTLLALMPQFSMREDARFPAISAWITAVVIAFSPIIRALLLLRDRRLRDWQLTHRTSAGEDRALEVLSSWDVDLIEYSRWIESLAG